MRPWVLPAAAIILAAVELFLLLGSYILPDPLLRHQPMPFSGWIVMALLGCLCLGYGLCLLWRNDTSPGTVRRRLVFIALSLWVFTVGLTVCHPSGFSYLPSLVLNPASNSYYQTSR